MISAEPIGVGVLGAGGFAQFVLSAAASIPELAIVAVTDPDTARAQRVADDHRARACLDAAALLSIDQVDAVIIAAPPDAHASLTLQALAAGRHVFCEKPIALTEADGEAVRAAVVDSGRTFVVDHVLRYNPVLAALCRLRDAGLLGPVQRLAVENDAADEDLPAGHWFWDQAVSGGILLEHGVHFFDAAAMLIGTPPRRVQAIGTGRPDGPTDTVVCTVEHAGGALASHAHGFSHPHRAERQLMRLDYGLAEARVHGWIPLRAHLDVWADDTTARAFEALPDRADQLLDVPGVRPSGQEQFTVTVERNAASAATSLRGAPRSAPHRIGVRIDLGGPELKQHVYRESVRAALLDLITCARTGRSPRADVSAGLAAVTLAAAGTRALHDGLTHRLPTKETPCTAGN